MSYTPFNAPLLAGLLGDMEIASFFSMKSEFEAMLRFETELAGAEAEFGVIPVEAAEKIKTSMTSFEPDVRELGQATQRDGVVVPELIRQLRDHVDASASSHVHFASTSQDIIDTSLILRLGDANNILEQRLNAVVVTLVALEDKYGSLPLPARTRMKRALQATVSDRLSLWRVPLSECRDNFTAVSENLMQLQFGGPVGILGQLGDQAANVRASLARRLALIDPGRSWHTDRSGIAGYVQWCMRVTTALGKIGLDATLMAQDEIAEVEFSVHGASSAMAHKQNPVRAEALVTLARFVGTMAAGMNTAALHEQERSGTSWALEWMLLPQLVVATGAALRNAEALLKSVESMGRALAD